MARLITSGFELNSATAGVEVTAIAAVGIAVNTTAARSGTYGAQLNALASTTRKGSSFQFVSANANGPYYFRFYVNFQTLPSAANRFLEILDTGFTAAYAGMTVDNTGALQLFDNVGNIGSASSALNTNQWYCIELLFDRTAAAGSQTITGRIDGTNFATSSARTIGSGVASIRLGGNLNAEAQTTGNWYFDDVAVNDSTGSSQTSYPGPGNVIMLQPNAAGDSNTFGTQTGGTAGAANNFTRVDETPPPDDATSFNGSSTLNQVDLFKCGASGIGASDTVNVVHVMGRLRNSTADSAETIKFEIEKAPAGTIAQSGVIIPNSTTWKTNNSTTVIMAGLITEYLDPDGLVAWTQATLDTMQIGYKLTVVGTGSRRIDVTSVFALVDYTPSNVMLVSVSDSVTVSENVDVARNNARDVSVFDSATVTENTTTRVLSFINLFESVTVSEDINPQVNVKPSVFDSITVSENIVILAPAPWQVSVFDSVTVTEALVYDPDLVYVREDIQLNIVGGGDYFLHINDSITVSESIQISYSLPSPIIDSVTVTENINLFITKLFVSVFDSVTVTENVNLSIPLPVNVFDLVTVLENTALIVADNVSVFDLITVSESLTIRVNLLPSIFDSVTVSENIKLSIPLPVSVFDSVTVSENLVMGGQEYDIDFETISVSEFISIVINVKVSPFDSVTVSENIKLLIPTLLPSVFDSITVTENTTTRIVSYISKFESISVSDVAQVFLAFYPLIISESITVSENFRGAVIINISARENITVSENISAETAIRSKLFPNTPSGKTYQSQGIIGGGGVSNNTFNGSTYPNTGLNGGGSSINPF